MAAAGDVGSNAAPPGRRRLGSMLSAYYGIEGGAGGGGNAHLSAPKAPPAPIAAAKPMDRQGFNAEQHFEDLAATASIPQLLKEANEVNGEVQELDGDMNMVIYENYSKFIRATEVAVQVKSTMLEFAPDVEYLEKSFGLISEHQEKVEEGISGRSREVELLLKRQRICRKLQALFDLPTTLQRCLDRGAYDMACAAYSNCVKILRQYTQVETFRAVLEDVEHQMGRIRNAVNLRLRSMELTSKGATNSALTLLDLGDDSAKVMSDYLSGRTSALRSRAQRCFAKEDNKDEDEEVDVVVTRAGKMIQDVYFCELLDAIKGFREIKATLDDAGKPVSEKNFEEQLQSFVRSSTDFLGHSAADLLGAHRPPSSEALLSFAEQLQQCLDQVSDVFPRVLDEVFDPFVCRIVRGTTRFLFEQASATSLQLVINLQRGPTTAGKSPLTLVTEAEVGELSKVKGEDKKEGEGEEPQDGDAAAAAAAAADKETQSFGFEDGEEDQFDLAEATKVEAAILTALCGALDGCRALVLLTDGSRDAQQQLIHRLEEQLEAFTGTLCRACCSYFHEDLQHAIACGTLRTPPEKQTNAIASLPWKGNVALFWAWLLRRFDDRVLQKAAAQAAVLVSLDDPSSATPFFAASAAAVKVELEAVAKAALAGYIRVCGQLLAHLWRDLVESRDYHQQDYPPREHSPAVASIYAVALKFETQLGRALADPRRQRSVAAAAARRNFALKKSDMENEIERQWARKLQVYTQVPWTRSGAISGIFQIALKGLYEYVRKETFTTLGLQQLQLDSELTAELARDLVEAEDVNSIDCLVAEALNSATTRCLGTPSLLEANTLESLCAHGKACLRQS